MLCVLQVSMATGAYLKLMLFVSVLLSWHFNQVRAACPPGWLTEGSDCYQVLTVDQPFTSVAQAEELCQNNSATLASLNDTMIRSNVYAHILSQTPILDRVFFGLTDIDTEGSFVSYDNMPPIEAVAEDSESWLTAESRACAMMHSSDQSWTDSGATAAIWIDTPCCFNPHNVTAALCVKPNSVDAAISTVIQDYCFDGCNQNEVKWNATCYFLQDYESNFNRAYDARQECQSFGADIASLTDNVTADHVTMLAARDGVLSDALYIGNNDQGVEDDFGAATWSMGTPSGTNSASVNCLALESDDNAWENDVTPRHVECCSNAGVSWVLCAHPQGGTTATVQPDDDDFAVACDGTECDSNPCQNGATCQEGILSYECECVPGYTGSLCETDIDECESDPCNDVGFCQAEINSYTCQCNSGRSGTNCETVVDACEVCSTCESPGTEECNHVADGADCSTATLECRCNAGYEGDNCETDIDECANVTCLNGGTCEDQVYAYHCQCTGDYYGDTCGNRVECATLPDIVNAVSDQNTIDSPLYGSAIEFTCDPEAVNPGYKFADMETVKIVTCVGNGWNDTGLSCDPHCDAIPEIANSDLPVGATTLVGYTLNYTCHHGYVFRELDNSTEFNTTCLPAGVYDYESEFASVPQCDMVRCPMLPTVTPHQHRNTDENAFNTTVIFWCDVGYQIYDGTTARSIRCTLDGDWTADLPDCEPIRCPDITADLGDSPGLRINNTRENYNTYNSYVKYTCETGLRMLDGASTRTVKCDATGDWSDQITTCETGRCFPLPYVANATPSTTDAVNQQLTTLTCIAGHRFDPEGESRESKTMRCQENHRWAPLLDACEPLFCEEAPHGAFSSPDTDQTLYGTIVHVNCYPGHYYPDDTSTIVIECTDEPAWNYTAIPDCEPISCDDPPGVPSDGTMGSASNSNIYDSEIVYTCDDGFKFIDGRTERIIRCNEQGEWSHTDVSCRIDRCNPTPEVSNASPDTYNTSWYVVVTYECNIGYHWPGSRDSYTINCPHNTNGIWNIPEAIPPCEIKSCPPVPAVANSQPDTGIRVYDTTVTYECDIGHHHLEGDPTYRSIYCTADQLWDPAVVDPCHIKYCPDLAENVVINATKSTNDTEYNTELAFDCYSGYQYPESTRTDQITQKNVTCQANETWTDRPTHCELIACVPVPTWNAVFNNTDIDFDVVVEYHCRPGNAFQDSNRDESIVKVARCDDSRHWIPAIEECVPTSSITQGVNEAVESDAGVPIGTIACALMCTLIAAIVLLDLNKLYTDLKMMKHNIESMVKSRKDNKHNIELMAKSRKDNKHNIESMAKSRKDNKHNIESMSKSRKDNKVSTSAPNLHDAGVSQA